MASPHGSPHAEPGEARAAFLRHLRGLREDAGLDQAGLAERAHYREDTLRAAETGPALPTLPALEAYVRACGADPDEWEDRWRRLTADGTAFIDGATAGETTAGQPPAGGWAAAGRPALGRITAPARTVLLSLGYVPRQRRTAIVAAAAALVAAAAGAFLWAGWPGSPTAHRVPPAAAPGTAGPGAMAPATAVPSPSRGPSTRAAARPPASPRPGAARPSPVAARTAGGASLTGQSAALAVAGVGCPDNQDDGFDLAGGPPGPGWTDTAGGWAGNGCDGAAVWTQATPGGPGTANSFTWFFHPGPGASACTLAVFVPTMDANGTGDYTVYAGAVAGTGERTVPVDQATSAGQWVTLGRFPASATPLLVQLTPASPAASTGAAAPAGPPGQAAKAADANPAVPPGHNSAIAASASCS